MSDVPAGGAADAPDDPVVRSLTAAVAAAPDDVALRLHLAELLLGRGLPAAALEHVVVVLGQEPSDAAALALLQEATRALSGAPSPPQTQRFDWGRAEEEVADITQPVLSDDRGQPPPVIEDVERPALTLADVGGLQAVKERLNRAFLLPLRNPQVRRLYGKSLRGGLLLYGPPGCGKTFLARALAGELDAAFYGIGLADVLDMYIGQSERNLRAVFETARRAAPCVLFFDEVDALGQRRSQLSHSAMRGTVGQFLAELDGIGASNEGVFVLAATNQPWDVDAALRRPGRFDRTVLVLPPDPEARVAILRHHLRDRPVAALDLNALARATEGYSGADLAHVIDTAAERAIVDSVRTGRVRPITAADLKAALREVRPSTRPWFDAARNVVLYAGEGGAYEDLATYMRAKKML